MSRRRESSAAERQAARHLHTRRGSEPRPVAAEAWHCAGVWQAEAQMDIWQCLDEVELDAMRERGDVTDDEDPSTDEHDTDEPPQV